MDFLREYGNDIDEIFNVSEDSDIDEEHKRASRPSMSVNTERDCVNAAISLHDDYFSNNSTYKEHTFD